VADILRALLDDPTVVEVHVLSRRALDVTHAKLRLHVVDFKQLPAVAAVDEVYLALGTTIRVAGSQEALRAVDFDANLAVAKAAGRPRNGIGLCRRTEPRKPATAYACRLRRGTA
jgi:hypothetical protein